MATRYIYLNEALNNRLKEETNVSALIVSLLVEHYKSQIKAPKVDLEEELNKVEIKKVELLNKLEEEKAILGNKIEIKNKEIEYQEKQKIVSQKIHEEKVNRIKDIFFEESGMEMSEDDLSEYLHCGKNIYQFMISKGYSKAPEDEMELDN